MVTGRLRPRIEFRLRLEGRWDSGRGSRLGAGTGALDQGFTRQIERRSGQADVVTERRYHRML
ncbi:MAG: hypothetical protein HY727_15795 [Candidatus Rokubacteria bacterium]|nr:hypothetical protein [Candidatus Rokubacteria bacterium]